MGPRAVSRRLERHSGRDQERRLEQACGSADLARHRAVVGGTETGRNRHLQRRQGRAGGANRCTSLERLRTRGGRRAGKPRRVRVEFGDGQETPPLSLTPAEAEALLLSLKISAVAVACA